MRYALGVDGGASKTHALIVDEAGRTLGFGRGGPSNHQVAGLLPALGEIESAVRAALAEANLPAEAVDLGCFCLGGADLPEDYAMLQDGLEGLGLCRAVLVKNDSLAAMRAGLSRPWGVAIICGTGFNAAGRAPDGREIVLPGLGAISGDWGCGSDLALEIIRLVMRAADGRGQPTRLTALTLGELGAPTESVLLARLYHKQIARARLLTLVPLLFEAGEAGDEVARELIVRMGVEAGTAANALIRRLRLPDDVEVVLAGGVFKGQGPLLIDTVSETVRREAARAQFVRLRGEPVTGAALLALEALASSR
jgi:N-acetylglucosamine kinase-like BadF-type ATPase